LPAALPISVRPADREVSGDQVQARAHGDGGRDGAHHDVARGLALRSGALHARGGDGQAVRLRGRPAGHLGGGADLRRLRLHHRVPGRALLARRAPHDHHRGDDGDPADDHRARAGAVGERPLSRKTRLVIGPDAPARVAAAAAWLAAHPRDAEVLVLGPSWEACDDLVRAATVATGARFGTVRLTLDRLAVRLATRTLARDRRAPATGLSLAAVAARTV